MAKYRKTPEAISRLSPEQYRVTQQSATEHPGTGEYLDNKEPGKLFVTASAPLTSGERVIAAYRNLWRDWHAPQFYRSPFPNPAQPGSWP